MSHQITRNDLFSVVLPKLLNGATTLGISLCAVRWLNPSAYGILSLCTNCLILFDALFGSALDLGVTKWVTGGDERVGAGITRVEKAAVYLKFLMGAALLLAALAAGEVLGFRIFQRSGGRLTFTVLATAGIGLLLLRSLQVYFQMRLQFSRFGATDLLYSTLRIVLVAAVVLADRVSAVAILACYAVAPLLVIATFGSVIWRRVAWNSEAQRRSDFRDLAHASSPALATFGVSSLVARMDLFFLAFRTDPVQLGLYGAGLTLATIPEIFGAYLAPVFLPRILPACRDGAFYSLFRRFHAIAYCCCGAALTASLLFSNPILSHVLPAKYLLSLKIMRILLPGTLAVASVFPLTLNYLMLRKPKVFLMIDLTAAPFLALAYLLVPRANGAVAAAWITAGFRVAKSCVAQAVAWHAARRERRQPEAEAPGEGLAKVTVGL